MTVTFDTSELDDLADDLAKAGPEAEKATSAAMTMIAGKLRADASANAPIDSGALSASIRVQGGQGYRDVFSDLSYAGFQEYGTSSMPPQPYFEPAIRVAYGRLMKAIEEAGEESLDL